MLPISPEITYLIIKRFSRNVLLLDKLMRVIPDKIISQVLGQPDQNIRLYTFCDAYMYGCNRLAKSLFIKDPQYTTRFTTKACEETTNTLCDDKMSKYTIDRIIELKYVSCFPSDDYFLRKVNLRTVDDVCNFVDYSGIDYNIESEPIQNRTEAYLSDLVENNDPDTISEIRELCIKCPKLFKQFDWSIVLDEACRYKNPRMILQIGKYCKEDNSYEDFKEQISSSMDRICTSWISMTPDIRACYEAFLELCPDDNDVRCVWCGMLSISEHLE